MPATIEETPIKPSGKAKRMVVPKGGNRAMFSRGPVLERELLPVNVAARHYDPTEILSGAPLCMAELAAYFDGLDSGQLRRGWKACVATVLVEEHEKLGILTHKQYKGLIRSTIMALEVIHERFIRAEAP